MLQFKSSNLEQVIAVGSAIAEDRADLSAASYSAAKHALYGLWKSVNKELDAELDFRLFSPGYMKTPMLPATSLANLTEKCTEPAAVAQLFVRWMIDPSAQKHYIIGPSQSLGEE